MRLPGNAVNKLIRIVAIKHTKSGLVLPQHRFPNHGFMIKNLVYGASELGNIHSRRRIAVSHPKRRVIERAIFRCKIKRAQYIEIKIIHTKLVMQFP